MKKADMKMRKEREQQQSSPETIAHKEAKHLSQYEKDEAEAMMADISKTQLVRILSSLAKLLACCLHVSIHARCFLLLLSRSTPAPILSFTLARPRPLAASCRRSRGARASSRKSASRPLHSRRQLLARPQRQWKRWVPTCDFTCASRGQVSHRDERAGDACCVYAWLLCELTCVCAAT